MHTKVDVQHLSIILIVVSDYIQQQEAYGFRSPICANFDQIEARWTVPLSRLRLGPEIGIQLIICQLGFLVECPLLDYKPGHSLSDFMKEEFYHLKSSLMPDVEEV